MVCHSGALDCLARGPLAWLVTHLCSLVWRPLNARTIVYVFTCGFNSAEINATSSILFPFLRPGHDGVNATKLNVLTHPRTSQVSTRVDMAGARKKKKVKASQDASVAMASKEAVKKAEMSAGVMFEVGHVLLFTLNEAGDISQWCVFPLKRLVKVPAFVTGQDRLPNANRRFPVQLTDKTTGQSFESCIVCRIEAGKWLS